MSDGIDEFLAEEDNDPDETEMTPSEVITLLEDTWSNEKFAPELLPHKWEVVECILGQLSHMEANLRTLPPDDFRKSIHQMELDRIRFVLISYLRTRIEKIETYVLNVLEQETERIEKAEELYLTNEELQFARNYKQCLEQHFEGLTTSVRNLPLDDDWRTQRIVPNLDSFVFLQSKSDVEGVVINDGTSEQGADLVDLNRGTQMIISYRSIRNLVKNGDVHLI